MKSDTMKHTGGPEPVPRQGSVDMVPGGVAPGMGLPGGEPGHAAPAEGRSPEGAHPGRSGFPGRRGRLGAYLRFFRTAVAVNLSAAMEYRVNFLVQVVGMMANNLAFMFFWGFLLNRTGPIGGYGMAEIMYLWAMAPATFGLATALFGNCRNLARLIREGDLDTFLLQPKDVLFNALVSRSSVSAWGDLIYGIIVFAVLGSTVGGWAAFLLFVLSGTIITVSVLVIGESLAFFVGGTEALSQFILELLLSFSLYPEKIFPQAMRWMFYSIIPTGFLIFLPLSFWKHPDPFLLVLIPSVAAGFALLARVVFRAGLGRYESGNKVGART